MILAGIDIGTNTIRLLIVEMNDATCNELYSGRTVTRLGQDLDRTGILSQEAQDRTCAALQQFSTVINKISPIKIRVVGTSALRNASNADVFIRRVKEELDLDVQIISGQDEARLTLSGVKRAFMHVDGRQRDLLKNALVMDIGGGSTEIILTRHGDVQFVESLPLGAVYLTERFLQNDPPDEQGIRNLKRKISSELTAWKGSSIMPVTACVGTAGTITTLAAMDQSLVEYDPEKINGYVLSKMSVDRLVDRLATSTRQERSTMAGLEPGREDIVLAGTIIVQQIMEQYGCFDILVSDWGLREGIVFDLYETGIADPACQGPR